MSRKIHGWNDIPSDYIQEEDFHLAPKWLRVLARTKFIEKFAYPIAVKKGLVRRWKIQPNPSEPEFFWADGIQHLNCEYPGFKHGAPIEIKLQKSRIVIPFIILRIMSFFMTIGSFVWRSLFAPFETKWGRNRKSEYVKFKISTNKN